MGINYEEYEEKSLESLITRIKTLCSIIEKYHKSRVFAFRYKAK